jgi:hypothetical protein
MTRNPWLWFLCGAVIFFIFGALYGTKRNLKPRLRQLDHKPSLRKPAARPPSIFDGSVGWQDDLTGEPVVTPDRGMREAT